MMSCVSTGRTSRTESTKVHLHLDPDLVMHKGIGLFHVHGHKDECMPMFALTYIPGAGNVDGKILETLGTD